MEETKKNNPTIEITKDNAGKDRSVNKENDDEVLDTKMDTSENENDDNNHNGDNNDDNKLQANYRMRPQLSEKFKPHIVKELIHNVLHDQLSSKEYNVNEAKMWTKTIADTLRNKMKELKFKDYKYVINVVLGEQKGAGVKVGNRCLWDAEADDYAYADFQNETLFCVACVYGVFYY